jgi:signal transduction histidine kinase
MAAGVYALRAPANTRFGVALLTFSVAWSLTALGEASASLPYTIGRAATWLILPSVYYLLLAFPEGRLAGGLDRTLFRGIVAVAVVLFFGTAFVVQAYPLHTPWATCVTDCPANALFVLHRQPPVMLDVVIPVREWLIDVLLLGLVVSMALRLRAASPLRRRMMAPVMAMGTAMALTEIAFYTARETGAPAGTVETLGWVWALCVIGVVGTFVIGLLWRRMMLAGALARLSAALQDDMDAPRVHDALVTALSDPTADLLLRDHAPGPWRDTRGRCVALTEPAPPGRAITLVGCEGDGPAVGLVHDVALRDDEELMSAVTGLVLAAFRHERVLIDLTQAMSELEDSRRRIAESADLERARIERDLHDGAQQRLIGIRIRAAQAEEEIQADPAAAASALRRLALEADRALEELRALGGGLYPPVLRDFGLEQALHATVLGSPVPVSVTATGLTRHRIEIEIAVYFVCVEALQNTMKHAPEATRVSIKLAQDHALHFEVRDDGRGFVPDLDSHRGLRNMRDRLEAVAGRLTIDASSGAGTRILGRVEIS